MPLMIVTSETIMNNYDLYEFSTVPKDLPGGGGFSIKNFTLLTLYSEHEYCRNVWTKTNKDLPLCRYTGCTFKFYQAENLDYIVTYDTQLPLRSNLDMYHTMQPNIHMMLQNRIIIPSKRTRPQKKPYTKIKIRPPSQLTNKWYFQKDLFKIPLVQIRASATSLTHYYQNFESKNSNITITILSKTIQNRNFKLNETSGYYCRIDNTDKIYLYSTESENTIQNILLKDLIFLGQTKTREFGHTIGERNPTTTNHTYTEQYWGNPFYPEYLKRTYRVFQTKCTISTMISTYTQAPQQKKVQDIMTYGFTEVFLTDALRYNPYRDYGNDNYIYFLPVYKNELGFTMPEDDTNYSGNLPLWLLAYGYADFRERQHTFLNKHTDYMVCISTKYYNNTQLYLPIISDSFIEGTSPHEGKYNPIDYTTWWPSYQFQAEMLNIIAMCGPGTPKIPQNHSEECKFKYYFYFKWGGNLPPMSDIQDPQQQPTYPVPNNFRKTNSLQNPETNPERLLYSFDERRGELTKKALKRMQQDWDTKTTLLTDAEQRILPPIQETHETSSESSSDEEDQTTQTLINKLYKQRRKQQQLKQLIIHSLKHKQK